MKELKEVAVKAFDVFMTTAFGFSAVALAILMLQDLVPALVLSLVMSLTLSYLLGKALGDAIKKVFGKK